MSADPQTLHALEVVLRDSRNVEVLMALNSLSTQPATQAELHAAVRNMTIVRKFIEDRVPEPLKPAATAVFVEHAEKMTSDFQKRRPLGGQNHGQDDNG